MTACRAAPDALRARGSHNSDPPARGSGAEALRGAPEAERGRVGRYRILHVIGRGGTGVVFRACDVESGEVVALKRVLAENIGDLGGMRREIDALRRLEHPGVVRILDQGIDAGVPWYAMELLDGETLASYVSRLWHDGAYTDFASTLTERVSRSRPPRALAAGDCSGAGAAHGRELAARGKLLEVLEIVRGLCDTLAFVHGEGVVHRDLKCANVMLCADGAPRLLDFGLAWRFPGGTGREVLDDVTRGAAGTAAYMSPEQIRGEMVDARADLYSLGCLLYELLTGRPPFSGRSAAEIRRCHLNVAVLPPSSLVDGVPPELDELVLRLLQKRVEDRPGHASEVGRCLRSLGAVREFWRTALLPRSYVYRSALVGRDETLRAFDLRVQQALQAQGSLLLLSGESGIGKTYLAMAAARGAAAQGLCVVTSTCLRLGAAEAQSNEASLHPFRSLLLAVADRCLSSPELAPALLGERARLLAACEPSLLSLPSVSRFPEPEALPASAAQQRLLQALAETLAAFAAVCPFVFVIDDLQWADDASLRFLCSLPSNWFSDKRLVIVGVYRADEKSGALLELSRRADLNELTLSGLSEPSLRELVRGMLALGSSPPDFVDLFVKQAEGNPFFAAEYLRTAVDERLLYRAPSGDWQIDDRLLAVGSGGQRLTLPSSIAALVGRRLDGLSEAAQELLAAAAVLGRELDWQLLLAVTELAEERAWEPARELCARQILEGVEPSSEGPRSRLRFLHDKLREAAHARIPQQRRRALHRRAAAALEQALQGSPELLQAHATLAYHHMQGEQWRAALEQLELAGDHALGTNANQDALRHFQSALDLDLRLAQGLDSSAGPRRGWAALRLARLRRARWERKLAEASYALGDLGAVERHILRALEQTGHSPPRSALGWGWSLLREAGQQLVHRARPGWRPRRHDQLQQQLLVEAALTTHHLAERSYFDFEAVPMIAASLRAVNLGERAGVAVPLAMPYAMLGMAAGISRLPALGERYFELALRTALDTSDRAGQAYSLYSKAAWKIGNGDWHEVRELCAECTQIALRTRNLKALGMAQTLLGHADFYTGRFRESADTYRELERSARANGDQQHVSWGLYAGARARMCLGELDEARAMLEESNALLEPLVEVPSKIIAPGLLASLHLRAGDLSSALQAAQLTASRIRGSLPTVFSTLSGYAGVAEVYLARWERELRERGPAARGTRAARGAARRALFDLLTLALSVPIGWPCYQRLRGEALRLDGKPRAASRCFERARVAARRLGMPYDEALAQLDLARVAAPHSSERTEHAARAEQMLKQLACPLDLERARRLLEESTNR
ncbi:MAG TPA: protein kinase [Polyangiaceae bacterium]|nr:protein kinase [Polyangiaceae bacterium]